MLRSDAIFCERGRYRYWLERVWSLDAPILPWVLLNSSSADAARNDPTVTRLIGFSRHWGFGGLWLVNAYAAVATQPEQLFALQDNVGERNRYFVRKTIRDALVQPSMNSRAITFPVIVGWGNHGAKNGHDHVVMGWIRQADPRVEIQCLGVTRKGCPRHPLYLPATSRRVAYEGRNRLETR